jgi:uncharacterized protein YkwD
MKRLQQQVFSGIALGLISSLPAYVNLTKAKPPLNVNSVSTGDTESPQSLNSLEQSVYEQINEYRQSKGLPPLVLDGWLNQHAREQSRAMARGEVSVSSQATQSRHQEIVNTGPYKQVSSVMCMTFGHTLPDRAAVSSWLKDPQQRFLSSIEGNYELTGVGVAMNVKGEYYFTQIFLLR